VADETARRYISDIGAGEWWLEDTIESEITVKDARLAHQHIRWNGKPWNQSINELEAMHWAASGRELRPVFDPACPTKIEFEGSQDAGGKQSLIYRFSSPANGCFGFYPLREARIPFRNPYNPYRSGLILVDRYGGMSCGTRRKRVAFPRTSLPIAG
jgi:hypothetical protein